MFGKMHKVQCNVDAYSQCSSIINFCGPIFSGSLPLWVLSSSDCPVNQSSTCRSPECLFQIYFFKFFYKFILILSIFPSINSLTNQQFFGFRDSFRFNCQFSFSKKYFILSVRGDSVRIGRL